MCIRFERKKNYQWIRESSLLAMMAERQTVMARMSKIRHVGIHETDSEFNLLKLKQLEEAKKV